MRNMTRLIPCLLVLVLTYNMVQTTAMSPSANLTLIKVAYLYRFAKFIEWPPEADRVARPAFPLCMFGMEAIEGALPALQGKSIKGKKVAIQYFAQAADLTPDACQILYVRGVKPERFRPIITRFREQPVLTVGDMERFAQRGGMIHFMTEGRKTRFAINIDAAQRAGLRIRSKLLKLAKIVKEE